MLRFLLIAAGLFFASGWAQGADTAGASGPNSAEFDRQFLQWKGILAELYQLRGEYREASYAKRVELDKQYRKLLDKADAMLPALRAAAEAAYLEAPDSSSDPATFLVATVYEACLKRAYEGAFPPAKLLMDHGYDRRFLIGWAGIAAFAVGQFDLAEKWLQRAREENVLANYGRSWEELGVGALRNCPFYKQAWKNEEATRAAEAKADRSPETWLPRVLLRTNKGEIELELFEDDAPNSVTNFILLVEDGFYNGKPFYAVQGQPCTAAGGVVGPEGEVRHLVLPEGDRPKRLHFRGSVTMPPSGDQRGAGTSQFYLLFFPQRSLNDKSTCIGRIVRGIDVLSRLRPTAPKEFANTEPDNIDRIIEAKVLRKRSHPYELKKVPEPKPGATGPEGKPGQKEPQPK
jgi:cyclophilin family peptidyl-prolyl cis-trans isomerase